MFVAALGTWTAWTPSLTSSGTTPTFANVTDESRYTQIGKTVTGKGQVTITAVGTGTYRLPLPVTPEVDATAARRIGFIQTTAAAGRPLLAGAGQRRHLLPRRGGRPDHPRRLHRRDIRRLLPGLRQAPTWPSGLT